MSKGLTSRDRILLVFLVILLVGVGYYLGYYKPYQEDMTSIDLRISETEAEIATAQAKAQSMQSMQDELDEIFSRPEDEITEIAPYDNAKVVMSQLNGILAASENYSLSFKDPDISDDGTVRRVVSMTFDCKDYDSAKEIISALSSSQWRCLITSIAVAGDADVDIADGEQIIASDVISGSISVTASITFFESKNIS